MRLKQYLNEKRIRRFRFKKQKKRIDPIVRIKKAESIVKKGLVKLTKELSSVGWSIEFFDLLKIMSSVWKRDRIKFIPDEGLVRMKELKNAKYMDSGDTDIDGDIELQITTRIMDYISKEQNKESLSSIKNEFAQEFVRVLSHELVHRAQWQSYGEIVHKSILKNRKVKDSYVQYKEYLKSPHEMMAYAQDAAYEIFQNREPGIYYLYQYWFDDEPEVFKSFVKIMKKSYKKTSDGEELIIEVR